MFERFLELINLRKKADPKKLLHVALTVNGIKRWCSLKKKQIDEGYVRSFEIIRSIIKKQIENDIRILTIYLLPSHMGKREQIVKQIRAFFSSLKGWDVLEQNQVKVSVVGKWYDLEADAIDSIKAIINETNDYDRFFLNFCINYNGNTEILDALKLVALKVKSDKLDPEYISKDMIKDAVYTSYFIPPDLLIKTGLQHKTFGFLLWDSPNAEIKFTDKLFPDYTDDDFVRDVRG